MPGIKKIKIGCDLFLNLKLYHLPEKMLLSLQKQYPDIEIIPVNVPQSPNIQSNLDIYWGNRITAEIIENCKNLKWIHFGSVGTNRARTKSVISRNITVTSSQGLVIAPMVASALSFITGLARGLHYSYALRNKYCLNRENFDAIFDEVQELEKQKILIVGLGDVGQRLAKVCVALGMEVIGIKQNISEKIPYVKQLHSLNELAECVTDSDFIINLLPLTTKTEQIFNNNVFAKMKSSAFFINIGRGETVDEETLISVLKNKSIAGAGLDVFAVEPLSVNSPLWDMDNVMLSPHVAGLSSKYWERQLELFSFNLQQYLMNNFTDMRNIVDMSKAI